MKTIAFFGHRRLYKDKELKIRLMKILREKVSQGYTRFLIGKHGEFDNVVLSSCLEYRRNNDIDVKIILILTSLTVLKKDSFAYSNLDYYQAEGCETMIYNIEEEYFNNQIVVSNRKMVDDSDLIICYVDMKEYKSGAKRAVKYALSQGKEVINLFRDEDRVFYGISKK